MADAASSDGPRRATRFGMAGHGVVFLLLGGLALALALGHHRGETDQGGALQELTRHTGGLVLLALVATGLAVYAVWQLSRIVTGDGGSERLDAVASTIANGLLSVTAFTVLFSGHASSQSRTQVEWTARVMRHEGGRWLIGVVGVVVLVVGVVIAVRGVRRDFVDDLDLSTLGRRQAHALVVLGLVGAVARAVVVFVTGLLLVVAAARFDPHASRGLDGALRSLRDTTFGPWLLVLVAVGLMMFGLYGLAEAKYRRL